MKQILATILIVWPLWIAAQNPFITDPFTADPTARVFDGMKAPEKSGWMEVAASLSSVIPAGVEPPVRTLPVVMKQALFRLTGAGACLTGTLSIPITNLIK